MSSFSLGITVDTWKYYIVINKHLTLFTSCNYFRQLLPSLTRPSFSHIPLWSRQINKTFRLWRGSLFYIINFFIIYTFYTKGDSYKKDKSRPQCWPVSDDVGQVFILLSSEFIHLKISLRTYSIGYLWSPERQTLDLPSTCSWHIREKCFTPICRPRGLTKWQFWE